MRVCGSSSAAAALFAALACAADPAAPATTSTPLPTATPTAAVAATPASADDGVVRRGAPLEPAPAVALSQLLARVDEHAGATVTVEGSVRRNCTRKGCWMELASGMDPTLPGARVTFRGYAFFVPLDSVGSIAKVQGVVEANHVSASAVAHYESEGAHYPHKLPDGSAHEIRIVASGVELRRP